MRSKALFLFVPAPSKELRLLSSSSCGMGKCTFGGDKVFEFTASVISPEASVGFWKRGIPWRDRSLTVLTIHLLLV